MRAQTREPTDATGIEALQSLARDAGAAELAAQARALAERMREGLFYVACLGQFKRGKSTLLNALLGEPLLPVGVVPVTSVVTVVRHGPRAARVRFAAGTWQEIDPAELPLYVTEDQNPENHKQVAAAEVFLPAELLEKGMCLVDTPGIGSIFAGNTEATRAFVPHLDAAIVVLGADPPISADELDLVLEVSRHCRELLFVLNKADRLPPQECQAAAAFTRKALEKRLRRPVTGPYLVSAAERAAGNPGARDWPAFEKDLRTLAQDSGDALVRSAGERGRRLIQDRLSQFLAAGHQALLLPVEEATRRVEALRSCVAEAERSLNDLGYLFLAEQERLGRIFAEKKDAFLNAALPRCRQEFAERLAHLSAPRLRLREQAVDVALQIGRGWLDRFLNEVGPEAERLYVEATRRFVDLANGFVQRLSASDAALSSLPPLFPPESAFRRKSGLFYTSLMSLTGRTVLTFLVDLLLSRRRRLDDIEQDVGAYLERVLTANANRIASDLDDRVLESRRRLQAELAANLRAVLTTAEAALARAQELRARGQQAVADEVARILSLQQSLARLSSERPA